MDFQLQEKVALVTGGSRGIGRAIALPLASQGMHVAICGRTQETLDNTAADIQKHKVKVWTFQTDVSQLEELEQLVNNTLQAAGRIDVLVNNAVTSTSAPFNELADDLFRYHIDVKLMAYIRLARLVLTPMRAAGWGRVVNIGGMTARMGAARDGQVECARALLAGGADRTLRATGLPYMGKTALEIAEAEGKAEVAALLRE